MVHYFSAGSTENSFTDVSEGQSGRDFWQIKLHKDWQWTLASNTYKTPSVSKCFSQGKKRSSLGGKKKKKSHLQRSNSLYKSLEEDWLSPLEASECLAEPHVPVFPLPPAPAAHTPGPLGLTAQPRRVFILLQASKTGSDISSNCRFTVSPWLVPLHCPCFPVWAWRKWPEG